MSFKNFFEQSIRGWLPAEPKIPKTKFKKLPTPVVGFLVASLAVALFSSVVLLMNPLTPLSVPSIAKSTPNSSYVELKGVLQQNNSFIMVLTDGSHISSKNLSLTYWITEKSGNECTIKIALECDKFTKEATIDGSIVDGNLVVDSTRSVFLINPNVTKNQYIMLTETQDWQLTANVQSTAGHPSIALEPYGVTAVMVSSHLTRTQEGWPLSVILGYDPDTGMLVYSGYSLNDVLLKKLGIVLLLGGSLELSSYSDNLNLEFFNWDIFWARVNMTTIWFFVQLVLVVATAVITVALFISRKIREKRQATQDNVKLLQS
ncbi:MAG: hypothetical protein NWF06_04095 [Candidatus Bathyarchaeota archaeon]|nr:hypothetical protein [Candidatus Bathyarchaeum sp.]